jgi:F1F0 ATPase subunit 2
LTLAPLLLRTTIFGTAGLVLGAAHFAALHVNTRLYLAGGSGAARAVGLHALRMALLVAAWLVVARFGGVALVAAFAGLLLARCMVTARIARAP